MGDGLWARTEGVMRQGKGMSEGVRRSRGKEIGGDGVNGARGLRGEGIDMRRGLQG